MIVVKRNHEALLEVILKFLAVISRRKEYEKDKKIVARCKYISLITIKAIRKSTTFV